MVEQQELLSDYCTCDEKDLLAHKAHTANWVGGKMEQDFYAMDNAEWTTLVAFLHLKINFKDTWSYCHVTMMKKMW
jgi:hypothetical protein